MFSSSTPCCISMWVPVLGAVVGLGVFMLLGSFSVCFFKTRVRRRKIKFAKSQLNVKVMNASGLHGLCSFVPRNDL